MKKKDLQALMAERGLGVCTVRAANEGVSNSRNQSEILLGVGVRAGCDLDHHEHDIQSDSVHVEGTIEGFSTGKKSWGERVEVEEGERSTKAAFYIQMSPNDDTAEGIAPGGNYGTLDLRAQLEKFHVNSETGSYGIHSPKSVNNEGLANMLQTTIVSKATELEYLPTYNKQQEKISIQFGSFNGTRGHLKQPLDNMKSHEEVHGLHNEQQREMTVTSNEDLLGKQADEGWETPKNRHVCRAKNLASTSQVVEVF
ncbi:hypothetical protein FRX31_016990 [Thalictrum thalictroides]|uniref:Uncharacterized protein n=1 Tax=Thalictrum thalictroides TaxID=46969 RepID=A0A7J6W941_THATH|nr:hypothetical protein FRX31_016990 [Thalictrum thalictroides]